jgi:hypothetical protein
MIAIAQVTNHYLFDRDQTPVNLVDSSMIRRNDVRGNALYQDMAEYMTVGAGRYAVADRFDLEKDFFNQNAAIAERVYPKEALNAALNQRSQIYITIKQSNIDVGSADFNERTYVWNTGAFKLGEGTRFIVAADGSRRIENLPPAPSSDRRSACCPSAGAARAWSRRTGR